jgi:hypothetical protein
MDRKQQILSLVEVRGPFTTGEVSAELLLDRANTSANLNALVSDGRLRKAKTGRLVYYSQAGNVPAGAKDANPNSRKREILNWVQMFGPATTNAVVIGLGLDRANTSANLNNLVRDGELNKGYSGREVIYSTHSQTLTGSPVTESVGSGLNQQLFERCCSHCGNVSEPSSSYCRICGTSLDQLRSRFIPTEVKQAVWSRDSGRCVKCGRSENLHYDHIIPFVKGGANSIENIQVMCAPCNFRKSDRIE